MQEKNKNKEFSEKILRKNPYRGIISNVAREEGVSPQSIWNSYRKHKNPRIIAKISAKVREIDSIVKESEKALAC